MFGTDPEAFSGCDTKAKEDNEVTLTELKIILTTQWSRLTCLIWQNIAMTT